MSRCAPADVLVVIPAFNEADALPGLLDELAQRQRRGDRPLDVLVVDDGSSDATAHVARARGVRVVRLPFNLGVGGAVRTGLRYASDNGIGRVVVIDADGQHDPADIDALLDALDDGAEMAIGSRFAPGAAGYEMGHTRRRAQRFLNWVVRKTTGFPATDATSGFRAFDRPSIEFLADRYPVEYLADTVEVIVLARGAGQTVVEVPVGMRQRQAGVPSSRSVTLLINYLRLLVGILGTAFVGRRERRAG